MFNFANGTALKRKFAEAAQQRTEELEAQLAKYRERFGEITE